MRINLVVFYIEFTEPSLPAPYNKKMTNQIISASTPVTPLSMSNGSNTAEVPANSVNGEFKALMSSMLSTTGLTPNSGTGNSGSDMMMPILLLLMSKLFGGELSNNSGELSASSPRGAPLKGILTQGSHAGHTALDFGVVTGTQVHSTMGGKVIQAGWNNEGYGNLVIVENGSYRTYYAHLSKIPVTVGQVVHSGDVVGLSGNTGNSTGPHLHYEVRKNGVAIDPASTMDIES